MKYDKCGIAYTTTNELVELLYQQPELDFANFKVEDPEEFNRSVSELYADLPILDTYMFNNLNIDEFDSRMQRRWRMPQEYHHFDIAQWLLDQCTTQEELQRIGQELFLYQERDLFNLLRYLRYFVITMRKHNIVWGVGRGSSVASYALYLIGVHKINSMYYDLDITEFLR